MSTTINNGYFKGSVCNGGTIQEKNNAKTKGTALDGDVPVCNNGSTDEKCTMINNGYFKGDVCNGGVVETSTPEEPKNRTKEIAENQTDHSVNTIEKKDPISEDKVK